ncbi:triggering receptor expressed on myeloid cells 3-like isoform X2 [Marmota flaviventris]|uniref:triggering receptor expressed on myeloid cells 3-like isoform X2 n=1 Tax=Marmota flaviventris TaxID=93162 RepID=UPI000FFF6E82|nr:triggering receptor expressed on myeloid cells 3-like isoform X2 [Marmota flaviventris]
MGQGPPAAREALADRRLREKDGMQGAGQQRWPPLGLLLLLLCVSGLQAEGESEEQKCLQEGRNLTVTCPYNINKYAFSLKAWQRVRSDGRLETLVITETRNADLNLAQAGRYLLEDYPTEAIIKVTMTGLQRGDAGLYQCVIHLTSQNLVILHHRIRLVQCSGLLELPGVPALIFVTCGIILNKGLVFSVLFVFLRKPRPQVFGQGAGPAPGTVPGVGQDAGIDAKRAERVPQDGRN